MSDAEYQEYKEQGQEESRKQDKAHGKYPWFAWGGVMVGRKTKLVFLRPRKGRMQGERLTSDIYISHMLTEVEAVRTSRNRQNRGRRRPRKLWLVQDNDPKHVSKKTRDFISKNSYELLGTPQLTADGSPDVFIDQKGRRTVYACDDLRFPPYSPDLNIIEKCWREISVRIYERRGEISSMDDHKRIITEEWDQLEFEPAERNGRRWVGINALCTELFPKVLDEVIHKKGWNTRYMK